MPRGGSSNGIPAARLLRAGGRIPASLPMRRQGDRPRSDRRRGRIPRHVFVVRRASFRSPAASSARVGSGRPRFSSVARRRRRHSPFPRTSSSSPSSSLMRSMTSPGGVSPFEATLAARAAIRDAFARRAPPPPHRLWPFPPPLADVFPQTRRARIRPRGPPVSLAKIRARRRGQPRVVRAEASRDRRRASTDSPRGERRVA